MNIQFTLNLYLQRHEYSFHSTQYSAHSRTIQRYMHDVNEQHGMNIHKRAGSQDTML